MLALSSVDTMEVRLPGGKEIVLHKVSYGTNHDLVIGAAWQQALAAMLPTNLAAWLGEQGDWVPLGGADEQKPAPEGSVEAWGRSEANPVGGWYGTRKGYRGRFGVYLPPLLEELGLAELEHNPKSNRMRAR